ncbi:MAG: DUF6282 family protein, partial [Gammaproteobacteria bacterium]
MSKLRIENAIDLHCHYGPDTLGGTLECHGGHSVTAVQAAREAAASGHAALVLKSHSFASPAVATAMMEVVPGLKVFGGICTDYASGGLNVAGVESALALGARIVWLPTVHSRQDMNRGRNRRGGPERGLAVTGEDGAPLDAVREIFELVRRKDAILATGHVTAAEHYAVIREFAPRGKVLVTHAGEELGGPCLDARQCAELADLGATIELTALGCRPVLGAKGKSPVQMGNMIRTIGPSRCTLATDYGWSTQVPNPGPGLIEFL